MQLSVNTCNSTQAYSMLLLVHLSVSTHDLVYAVHHHQTSMALCGCQMRMLSGKLVLLENVHPISVSVEASQCCTRWVSALSLLQRDVVLGWRSPTCTCDPKSHRARGCLQRVELARMASTAKVPLACSPSLLGNNLSALNNDLAYCHSNQVLLSQPAGSCLF